jgi:hypothetical protein
LRIILGLSGDEEGEELETLEAEVRLELRTFTAFWPDREFAVT